MSATPVSPSEVQSGEYPVTFRFGVSWSCLGEPLRFPRGQEPTAARVPTVFTASTPVIERQAAAPPAAKLPRVFTSAAPPPAEVISSTLALPPGAANPLRTNALPAIPPASASTQAIQNLPPSTPAARAPSGEPGRAARSTIQWEMVVPKMSRPVRHAPLPEGSAQPRPGAPASRAQNSRAQIASPPSSAASRTSDDAGPTFGMTGETAASRAWTAALDLWKSTPLPFKLTLFGAAAVILGVVFWPQAAPPAPKISGDWIRESATPAGGPAQGPARQFVLYRTSRPISDYRLGFDWTPDTKGAGWVMRATDARYYVGARVSLLAFRTPPTVVAERFTVSAGVESPHFRALVPLTGDAYTRAAPNAPLPPIEAALEVSGSTFNLYVQGRRVDSWIDQQFLSGDAGFYWDRETPARGGPEHDELPSVRSVRLSFVNPSAADFTGTFPVKPGGVH